MGRIRADLLLALALPALLVSGGCANLRLPAIDPSGRQLFLPRPNYTTLARDGFLSRLHQRGPGLGAAPGTTAAPLPGPYEPALLNRHRQNDTLQRMRDGTRRLFSGLHGDGLSWFHHRGRAPATLFGNSAYPRVPNPPLCGADGQAPAGSPCYPVGSPSASSLAATLPGSAVSGLDPGWLSNSGSNALTGMNRFAQVGPGVTLAQPRYTARVGDEVVVLGGIQSSSGIARGGEPVKWSLSNDSVGTIVDAARPAARPRLLGFLHRASARYRTPDCGSCVDSITSDRCRVITRSPGTPADDVYLSKGQSWVSVTSGSAGQSFVTLAAPELSCGRRAATAIIDWTDATWECPQPVLKSTESPAQLITRVFRNTDGSPLPNWTVRYTYIDGPTVTYDDNTSVAVNVKTDANGRAIFTAYPSSKQPGTTRFAVQIFDPALPAQPVYQGIGYITWSESEPVGGELQYPVEPAFEAPPEDSVRVGPPEFETPDTDADVGPTEPFTPPFTSPPAIQPPATQPPVQTPSPRRETRLAIKVDGPERAELGQRVSYNVVVTNTGDADAERVSVLTQEPTRGLRVRRRSQSDPYVQDGALGWDLGFIPAGRSKTVVAEFDVVGTDIPMLSFEADAENSVPVRDRVVTAISGKALRLLISDPDPFPPEVGQGVVYEVAVENRSNAPQPVRLIILNWSSGLRPVVSAQAQASGLVPTPNVGIVKEMTVPPGPSQRVAVPFETLQAGPQQFTIIAEVAANPNNPAARIEPVREVVPLNIQPQRTPTPPPASSGPLQFVASPEIQAGGTGQVRISVTNRTSQPFEDVQLRYLGNRDLYPTQNSTVANRFIEDQFTFVWSLGRINPNEVRMIEVEIEAATAPAQSMGQNQIELTSDRFKLDPPPRVEIPIRTPRINDGRRGIQTRRVGLESREPGLRAVDTKANSLQAMIETVPAVVQSGEAFEIIVTLANQNRRGYRDVAVTLNFAQGIEILDYRGPPMTRSRVSKDGRHLNFGMVREILPSERLIYRTKAVANRSGEATTVARVEATGLVRPVIVGTDYEVR